MRSVELHFELVVEKSCPHPIIHFYHLLIYLNPEDVPFNQMVDCLGCNGQAACIACYGSFVVGRAKGSFD